MSNTLHSSYFPITKQAIIPLLALLALAVGIGLRFHNLERKIVWHDEVLTITRVLGFQEQEVVDGVYNGKVQTPEQLLRFQRRDSGRGFMDAWHAIEGHPEHSPLYYVLASLATHILPDSPLLAVRGTAVLLSLLLFPAMFWLAWEWSRERMVAWIALALVAVSPLHLLYAQEAREYALLTVLTVAASAALLHALHHKRWRCWILYSVILTLGFYTHLLFAHVLLAHALYLAWCAWKQPTAASWGNIRRAAMAVGITVIAISPWLMVLMQRTKALYGFTAWMGSMVTTKGHLAYAVLGHVNRIFVDLPWFESWWILGAIILGLMVWHGLRHITSAMFRFWVCLMIPSLLLVILPDLLFGGIRSIEIRYLLQPLLALEVMVAWTIATGLTSLTSWTSRLTTLGFGILLWLGLASMLAIDHADSWWNKYISTDNLDFAQVINATKQPLVVGEASKDGSGRGELISLAYNLASHVRVSTLAPPTDQAGDIPPGYSDLFLLRPSLRLQKSLKAKGYQVVSFHKTWRFIATPMRQGANYAALETIKTGAQTDATPIINDDFSLGPLNSNIWHIPTWHSADDGTFVGRTKFRCTQDSPLPKISDGNILITAESYNPRRTSFYGTDLISNQAMAVGPGLRVRVRAKMNAPVQPGVVGGIFLYALPPGSKDIHDEIDFEFLGTQPDKISTNIYGNEPLGVGHSAFFPYTSGSVTDYHNYEIQLFPHKVLWLVDGKLLRTETTHVPAGAMSLHLNIWVPDPNWAAAYSATIQPTLSPSTNQVFTMSVDAVKIEALPLASQL